jgi:DNA-binding response OmpR family regulator
MPKKPTVSANSKILWIEGRWSSSPNFVSILEKKGFNIDIVSTGKAALEVVERNKYDLVVVNAASMRTSGKRICMALKEKRERLPILLICDPEKAVKGNPECMSEILVLPFTSRKLVNRIEPLLPGDEARLMKVGTIRLDKDRNQVRCHGKKTTLTPRLIRLLEMLIDNRGEVVPREELFKKVWRTNYTGDTRTLDVHISWLRQAIEKDPRKPQLLKTIRGVGYRLDV